MSDFCIVSDATLDLTSDMVTEADLQIVPMDFTLDHTPYCHYPDERELSSEEFYSRLKAGADSVTSQINLAAYERVFTPLLKQGKDILYICFSSGLSGTYNVACLAAKEMQEKYPERKIAVVDSLCASVGEGLLVYLAARERQQGRSLEEVQDFVLANRRRVCHWFTVEDLHHLRRGGRLTAVAAMVGSVLRVCPILSVDREGRLIVVHKSRGHKKAMEYLLRRLREDGTETKRQTIIVAHAAAPEYAQELKEMIEREGLAQEVRICRVGPVIGTHTGAGMCAVTFLGENYRF